MRLEDAPGGLDAVEAGHRDVHHNGVGQEGVGLLDGRVAVGGLAHHNHVGFALQQGAQAVAHHLVVVDEEIFMARYLASLPRPAPRGGRAA